MAIPNHAMHVHTDTQCSKLTETYDELGNMFCFDILISLTFFTTEYDLSNDTSNMTSEILLRNTVM
jgi:hypothetical protein